MPPSQPQLPKIPTRDLVEVLLELRSAIGDFGELFKRGYGNQRFFNSAPDEGFGPVRQNDYSLKHFQSAMPWEMQSGLKNAQIQFTPLLRSLKDLSDISSGPLKAGFLKTSAAVGNLGFNVVSLGMQMKHWSDQQVQAMQRFAEISPSMAGIYAGRNVRALHGYFPGQA